MHKLRIDKLIQQLQSEVEYLDNELAEYKTMYETMKKQCDNACDNIGFHTNEYTQFTLSVSLLLRKVIQNSLANQNKLALQLDYQFGNISEKEFKSEFENYERTNADTSSISKDAETLLVLTGLPLDAIDISGLLNCSVGLAEQAIQQFVRKSNE